MKKLPLSYFIFEFLYTFKITCILLRQVIFLLKKMVVLSPKFTILISWSPTCILLILLSTLMKLGSTSVTTLYKSMGSKHPWRTNIRVKGLDRRPFVLTLDLILVYATLIMWINLSPYPNLCKAEKIKSTVRILQKDIYSIYLTHQLCRK